MTKNVVELERRVPDLTTEELDFVKSCLCLNPKDRLTSK